MNRHARRREQRLSLTRDRRGTVAIFFTASTIALLCMAGLVVDSADVYASKRWLQGATDLAAMAAATDIANAVAAADATAVSNGYDASEVTQVTLGVYTADPSIPAAQRFQPASESVANAVQVTMTHQVPLFFAPVFQLQAGSGSKVAQTATVVTQGIASLNRSMSFGIGSTVASFNGGVVNALLGATVGANVSLSALSYQSLLSTQVDLFALDQALAAQVGQVGGSYGQAASGTVTMSQFIAALEQVAPGATSALQTLGNAASLGTSTVNLSQLIDFGPYSVQLLSEPEPAITATASVMQLLQAAAQVGGAPHLISLNLNANIPGITTVTGMMTIGEPAQGTTVLAIDKLGSSVHTAQVRLYLDVTLGSTVDGAAVQLPLYMEVGYGTAAYGGLSCNALDNTLTKATLNVTPGLVNGWIGSVTSADMTNYTAEPVPGAATLLNVGNGLLTVTGRANATVGDTASVPVVYNATQIQNVSVQTTDTTDFVGSLVTSLIGNLKMQVNVVGLSVVVPPGLTSSVSSALSGAVSPVDQLITSVLSTAGVGVGEASTWVSGAHCSAATLAG
jgi:uncharacterized membrane protein